jgi:hypothetical protein
MTTLEPHKKLARKNYETPGVRSEVDQRGRSHAPAGRPRERRPPPPRGRADELLTLTDGPVESGYSAEYLGALIRQGKIQNAGRPHAPRIRRQDLPRKASRLPDPPPSLKLVGATPRQIARAIISSKE